MQVSFHEEHSQKKKQQRRKKKEKSLLLKDCCRNPHSSLQPYETLESPTAQTSSPKRFELFHQNREIRFKNSLLLFHPLFFFFTYLWSHPAAEKIFWSDRIAISLIPGWASGNAYRFTISIWTKSIIVNCFLFMVLLDQSGFGIERWYYLQIPRSQTFHSSPQRNTTLQSLEEEEE